MSPFCIFIYREIKKKRNNIYKIDENGDKNVLSDTSDETKLSDNSKGDKIFAVPLFLPLHRANQNPPLWGFCPRFCPLFVPCLSPVCPLPSNRCSRKSGLFRYTGVLEGTKMGTKFVPFVPFCPPLSPFPSNVCLFVRTNLERVFVFSRKWGLSQKSGQKHPQSGD